MFYIFILSTFGGTIGGFDRIKIKDTCLNKGTIVKKID